MARVIELPLLEMVGDNFIPVNGRIEKINIDNLRKHGINFLSFYDGDINGRKIR